MLSRRRGPAHPAGNAPGLGGPITSLAEGGCPDLDPFHGSGCGAKLICNRLARLAKTVRLLAPVIAAVRCHSPSSRTKQVHLRLERASPAAQPISPRHKRSRSSSIGSPEAGGARYPRRSTPNRPTGNNQVGSPDWRSGCRAKRCNGPVRRHALWTTSPGATFELPDGYSEPEQTLAPRRLHRERRWQEGFSSNVP